MQYDRWDECDGRGDGMNFSAVILAGGKSSRMGQDKAWLQIHGESLLRRQIRLVREVGANEVLISGKVNADYSSFGCRVLHDRFVDAGPLAGIESALAAASSSLVLVLAVDMPRMQAPLLRQLLSKCNETVGAIPRVDGAIEPLAAFYPKAAGSQLEGLLSTTGLTEIGSNVARVQVKSPSATAFAEECLYCGMAQFVDLAESETHLFANWNSPEHVEKRGLA
jgi:molybdenum cofactor guanylyltransferase